MIDDQIPAFESIDEISQKIAEIDDLISLQLDEILHHPEFKALEASWRGIFYLVNQIEYSLRVKIVIFHAGKKELLKDFERAVELKDSALYKKIFADVYEGGHLAGFGMLIGTYEFDHSPQDVTVIEKMGEISALAHAPFIAGVSPTMFDQESFEAVQETSDWSSYCRSPEYDRWNSFRRTADARYVGLCMPHILLREPYEIDEKFIYRELSEKPDLLWGNAAFAFAGCVVRAFCEKSWLGKMCGLDTDGAVEGLSVQIDDQNREFSLDADVGNHLPTISDLGFMSLVDNVGGCPYFFDSQSTNKPQIYDTEGAMKFHEKWAKIENILAMSRFVVNIMSFRRDNFYRFETEQKMKKALNNWLEKYFHYNDSDSDEVKAKRPLREYILYIGEIPNTPNEYKGVLYIRPTYLLDEIEIAMRAVIHFPALGYVG
jgi:type VI secretion system protein ImpC